MYYYQPSYAYQAPPAQPPVPHYLPANYTPAPLYCTPAPLYAQPARIPTFADTNYNNIPDMADIVSNIHNYDVIREKVNIGPNGTAWRVFIPSLNMTYTEYEPRRRSR